MSKANIIRVVLFIILIQVFYDQKMNTSSVMPQQPADFQAVDSVKSIKLIEEDYECRRQFRRHKIETIKHRLQNSISIRQRKSQSIIFYFLNLCIPIVLTCLNAYILLDLGVNSQLKGKLIITFCSAGFIISIISNLQIAPWKQILKLYFLIDSLVPVFISGVIGFFAVFNYLSTGQWYEMCFQVCFPLFAFYFAGSLRVMIAYQKWQKWKVIVFKISVLISGVIFFYVGVVYMNGAYKISEGYFPSVEEIVKNVVYLYVFGNCDLFFGFYRKISDFDQTSELKYQYQFKSRSEEKKKKLIESQMLMVEEQVMVEQFKDRIETKMVSLYYKQSKFANTAINKDEIKIEA